MADPVYAVTADLSLFGINPNALANLNASVIPAALSSASREVDGYLRTQFKLPLLAWGDDIKKATCVIAVYSAMSFRGFNPENGADKNIRDRYQDTIRWLTAVSKGSVIPAVTDSASGSAEGRPSSRPIMYSSPQRGWSAGGTGRTGPFQGE